MGTQLPHLLDRHTIQTACGNAVTPQAASAACSTDACDSFDYSSLSGLRPLRRLAKIKGTARSTDRPRLQCARLLVVQAGVDGRAGSPHFSAPSDRGFGNLLLATNHS